MADKTDVGSRNIALLLLALAGLALALALWRARKQLAKSERDKRELEASSQILEEERHVLELIAHGATLKEVLEALTQAVENVVPGVFCSVLLVDRDGRFLLQGAAPHLPPGYWRMCDGIPITPDLGCCPTAVCRNEMVISEDIGSDSRWAPIRDAVLSFGLQSCWSVPIRDSKTGQILGTFAMYRDHPSKPTPFEIRAVQTGAELAGKAIERLRTEQNLRDYAERFALAEKAAAFGIWEWDTDTGVFELSENAALMGSFAPNTAQVTRQELHATIHPDDRDATRLAREAAHAVGGTYEHEFRRLSPDGSIRWFRNRGTARLKDGKPKVIGATIDITEQKELLLNLEKAKSAAEEALRARSAFLANMSHEIRPPMNAVVGMTSLLLDLDLPANALDYVRTIRTSSDSLLGIINDILDLSKIESGKLELEHIAFSLRECLEEAVELLESKAAEKDLELVVDIDPAFPDWVYGDPSRLRQVVVNLVSNAVKFTAKGEVVLSLEKAFLQGSGEIVIAVRDTGIGIPPEKRDRLFRPFSQVDSSTTRRFGGTGLGLSISKRLAEMMGGRLTVESVPDVGSTFRFFLPFEPSPALKPPPIAFDDWPGKRVLIVDDNATSRRVLFAYLSHWGLAAEAMSSSTEALRRSRDEHWDLLILDWRLSRMDGAELAVAFKTEPALGGPPIVRLIPSAIPSNPALRDQISLFAAQINKPVRRQHLHRALAHVLSGRSETPSIAKSLDPGLARRIPLRILVADDNPVNQKVAVHLLERWGFRPDVAQNGIEVLDALRRRGYDLVLLDVQMPEMDGLEAAERIRAEKSVFGRPRLIALTAGAFKEDRDRCIQAGMDGFLSKPLNVSELRTALENCHAQLAFEAEKTLLGTDEHR